MMTSTGEMEASLAEVTRHSCLEQDQIEASPAGQTIVVKSTSGGAKICHLKQHSEVARMLSTGYSISNRWSYLNESVGVIMLAKSQSDSVTMDTVLVIVDRAKCGIVGTIPVTYKQSPILEVSVRECKVDSESHTLAVVVILTVEVGGFFAKHICQTMFYDIKRWSLMYMFSTEGSSSPSLLFHRPGEVIITGDVDGNGGGPCLQVLDVASGDTVTYADCQLFGDDGDTMVYLYPARSPDQFVLVVLEYLGNSKSLRMAHLMSAETLQPVGRFPVGLAATCHPGCPPLVEPHAAPASSALRFINRKRFGDGLELAEYPFPDVPLMSTPRLS